MAQLCEDHSVAPAQTLGGYDIPVLKAEATNRDLASYMKAFKAGVHTLDEYNKHRVASSIQQALKARSLKIDALNELIHDPTVPRTFAQIESNGFEVGEAQEPTTCSDVGDEGTSSSNGSATTLDLDNQSPPRVSTSCASDLVPRLSDTCQSSTAVEVLTSHGSVFSNCFSRDNIVYLDYLLQFLASNMDDPTDNGNQTTGGYEGKNSGWRHPYFPGETLEEPMQQSSFEEQSPHTQTFQQHTPLYRHSMTSSTTPTMFLSNTGPTPATASATVSETNTPTGLHNTDHSLRGGNCDVITDAQLAELQNWNASFTPQLGIHPSAQSIPDLAEGVPQSDGQYRSGPYLYSMVAGASTPFWPGFQAMSPSTDALYRSASNAESSNVVQASAGFMPRNFQSRRAIPPHQPSYYHDRSASAKGFQEPINEAQNDIAFLHPQLYATQRHTNFQTSTALLDISNPSDSQAPLEWTAVSGPQGLLDFPSFDELPFPRALPNCEFSDSLQRLRGTTSVGSRVGDEELFANIDFSGPEKLVEESLVRAPPIETSPWHREAGSYESSHGIATNWKDKAMASPHASVAASKGKPASPDDARGTGAANLAGSHSTETPMDDTALNMTQGNEAGLTELRAQKAAAPQHYLSSEQIPETRSLLQPMAYHNCVVREITDHNGGDERELPVTQLDAALTGQDAKVFFDDRAGTVLSCPIIHVPEPLLHVPSVTKFADGRCFRNWPLGASEYRATGRVLSDPPVGEMAGKPLEFYRARFAEYSTHFRGYVGTVAVQDPLENRRPDGQGNVETELRQLEASLLQQQQEIHRAMTTSVASITSMEKRLIEHVMASKGGSTAREGIKLPEALSIMREENVLKRMKDLKELDICGPHRVSYSAVLVILALELCRVPQRSDEDIFATLKLSVAYVHNELQVSHLQGLRNWLFTHNAGQELVWVIRSFLKFNYYAKKLLVMLERRDTCFFNGCRRHDPADILGFMLTLREFLGAALKCDCSAQARRSPKRSTDGCPGPSAKRHSF